jgi:hypothetical protein
MSREIARALLAALGITAWYALLLLLAGCRGAQPWAP